ncbi:MAG: S1C family serine protease [Phenylobacterium sp.]
MRSALAPGLCALALALSGPADAAARKLRTPALGEAVYSLLAGDVWGSIARGKACERDPQPLRWDAGLRVSDPAAIFTATLNPDASKPTLRVEATISELNGRLCALSGKRTNGALAMTVTWKVIAPTQDAPLAIVQTHASGDAGELAADNLGPLLEAAFRANVQALAADAAFQQALKPPPRPRPKPRPPQIEVPLADMRLGLVAAAAPMPLGQAAQGVVSILAGSTLGSGVLITGDGYLLTNEHVTGRAKTVTVRWPDGSETPGEVVRADKRRDVALVKTEPPKLRPLAIRRRPVTLAETVYAIGTPRETDFAGTLTRGVVSTVQRVIDGQPYIQSDVAITHGNSGGPLLDEKGAVVGLSVLIYEPGGVPQNINFFVPIEEALKALAIRPRG